MTRHRELSVSLVELSAIEFGQPCDGCLILAIHLITESDVQGCREGAESGFGQSVIGDHASAKRLDLCIGGMRGRVIAQCDLEELIAFFLLEEGAIFGRQAR